MQVDCFIVWGGGRHNSKHYHSIVAKMIDCGGSNNKNDGIFCKNSSGIVPKRATAEAIDTKKGPKFAVQQQQWHCVGGDHTRDHRRGSWCRNISNSGLAAHCFKKLLLLRNNSSNSIVVPTRKKGCCSAIFL